MQKGVIDIITRWPSVLAGRRRSIRWTRPRSAGLDKRRVTWVDLLLPKVVAELEEGLDRKERALEQNGGTLDQLLSVFASPFLLLSRKRTGGGGEFEFDEFRLHQVRGFGGKYFGVTLSLGLLLAGIFLILVPVPDVPYLVADVEVDEILVQFADFRLCNLVIAVIKISKNIMLEVCMKV